MASRGPAIKRSKRVSKGPLPLADLDILPRADAAVPKDPPTPRGLTVIGSHIDVVGSIYIDAHVRLEGTIAGEIRCTELDVGRQAHVRGRIVAERVTVHGTVVAGSIYANVLILRPGCKVEAEIFHRHLQLEPGSYFDGKSRRVDDPTSLAPD